MSDGLSGAASTLMTTSSGPGSGTGDQVQEQLEDLIGSHQRSQLERFGRNLCGHRRHPRRARRPPARNRSSSCRAGPTAQATASRREPP